MKYSKIAIIAALNDPAGMNIKQKLIDNFSFEQSSDEYNAHAIYEKDHSGKNISIYTVDDILRCNDLDKDKGYKNQPAIDADLFIFASRHRSADKKPSLCVHVPGNWGKAEYGGRDNSICIVPSSLIRLVFLQLQEKCKLLVGELPSGEKLEYEAAVEVTHHGPIIDKPCFFIEIGSYEAHWDNPVAGKLIAEVIMKTLEQTDKEFSSVIVLGGSHYNQVAAKIINRTNYAVGHICPKHCLEFFDEDMLKQAIDRGVETPEYIVLDWKGLGSHKGKIRQLLEGLHDKGIKSEKYRSFIENHS